MHLIVHSASAITWEVLGTVVRGLQAWFEKWEFVECDFDMGQIGLDALFGTGVLVRVAKGVE